MTNTDVNKPAPKKEAAKKKADANYILLAQLCREAEIEAKLARVRLRASKLKKSAAHGWAWPKGSDVLKEVKKIIAGGE